MKNQTLIERILELENDISVIIGMLSEFRVDVREKNEMAYEYGLEVYKKTSLFRGDRVNDEMNDTRKSFEALGFFECLFRALTDEQRQETYRHTPIETLAETIRCALKRCEEVEWKDIESAPRDTLILVCPNMGMPFVGDIWHKDCSKRTDIEEDELVRVRLPDGRIWSSNINWLQCWQPLPKAPQSHVSKLEEQ